jgi:hypothetical protein
MTSSKNTQASTLPLDPINISTSSVFPSSLPHESVLLKVGTVVDINNSLLSKAMEAVFMEFVVLRSADEDRVMPTAFFVNDLGLQIWSQITKSPTYHQTNDEIKLLESYGADITNYIVAGSTLIDIGAR